MLNEAGRPIPRIGLHMCGAHVHLMKQVALSPGQGCTCAGHMCTCFIVTDERRRAAPKAARPFGVVPGWSDSATTRRRAIAAGIEQHY
jgi:hypothetical protein